MSKRKIKRKAFVVTQHTYDEDVETCEFECRLNLFSQRKTRHTCIMFVFGYDARAQCMLVVNN